MLRGSGAPVPLSPAQAQMVKHLAVECIWSFMMVDAALNKQFYTRETEAALIKRVARLCFFTSGKVWSTSIEALLSVFDPQVPSHECMSARGHLPRKFCIILSTLARVRTPVPTVRMIIYQYVLLYHVIISCYIWFCMKGFL